MTETLDTGQGSNERGENMTDNTCEAHTFEETAALLCRGHAVSRAELRGNRVAVFFADEDGAAAEDLQVHRTSGLPTDSLTFEVNLRRAKSIIFGARNGGASARNGNDNGGYDGRRFDR